MIVGAPNALGAKRNTYTHTSLLCLSSLASHQTTETDSLAKEVERRGRKQGGREGGRVGGALPLSLFLSLMERLSWQRRRLFGVERRR